MPGQSAWRPALLMLCRRNPGLSAMAALLVLTLLGGMAGIAWKWREADHERVKTEAVNELLTRRLLPSALLESDPQSKDLTVLELVDRTAAQLGGWLEGQPDVEARIRETIGAIYLSLGRNDQAAPHVEAAIRLDIDLHGPRHRDTIRATNLLTLLLDRTGQGALAETRTQANLERARGRLVPTIRSRLNQVNVLARSAGTSGRQTRRKRCSEGSWMTVGAY